MGAGDWALALAAIGAIVGLLTLAQRIAAQLLARIDALGEALRDDMRRQFEDADAHRQEAAAAYRTLQDERHAALAESVRRQAEDLAATRATLAQDYLRAEDWKTHAIAIHLKLDQLYALTRRDHDHG